MKNAIKYFSNSANQGDNLKMVEIRVLIYLGTQHQETLIGEYLDSLKRHVEKIYYGIQ